MVNISIGMGEGNKVKAASPDNTERERKGKDRFCG
jgi:hypothetical protein